MRKIGYLCTPGGVFFDGKEFFGNLYFQVVPNLYLARQPNVIAAFFLVEVRLFGWQ